MSERLKGKLALVTGAGGGIGRACAVALAREGASVIASDRHGERLRALENAVDGIRGIAGDVTDSGFVRELAAQAAAANLLVHNAAVVNYAPLLELSDADCEAMFRTNVLAALNVSRAVARNMIQRGGGHIIMMTSLAAREVFRFAVVYCATKHALSAITTGLRLELQANGIKVTEMRPGSVATEFLDRLSHPEVLAAIAARPYQPLAAEDVAEAVVYAATTPSNACADVIELRPRGAA